MASPNAAVLDAFLALPGAYGALYDVADRAVRTRRSGSRVAVEITRRDPDDVVQETFARALSARPFVGQDPAPWLRVIVKSVVADGGRRWHTAQRARRYLWDLVAAVQAASTPPPQEPADEHGSSQNRPPAAASDVHRGQEGKMSNTGWNPIWTAAQVNKILGAERGYTETLDAGKMFSPGCAVGKGKRRRFRSTVLAEIALLNELVGYFSKHPHPEQRGIIDQVRVRVVRDLAELWFRQLVGHRPSVTFTVTGREPVRLHFLAGAEAQLRARAANFTESGVSTRDPVVGSWSGGSS